jgi:mRNA interferase RelE/StbE
LTSYRLAFLPSALKEWEKLGANIREQFKKRLAERLHNPHVATARLSSLEGCYKIKLRAAGYRLVYRVEEERVTVVVVAVGKRDRNIVYKIASGRVRKA